MLTRRLCSKRVFHISSQGAEAFLSRTFPSFGSSELQGSLSIPAPAASSSSSSIATSVFRGSSGGLAADDLDDMLGAAPLGAAQDEAEGALLPLGMTVARCVLEALVDKDNRSSAAASGGVVVLGKFVGEGDNIGDGLELAALLLNSLGLGGLLGAEAVRPSDLVHPESWSRRYGGGITDSNMFY